MGELCGFAWLVAKPTYHPQTLQDVQHLEAFCRRPTVARCGIAHRCAVAPPGDLARGRDSPPSSALRPARLLPIAVPPSTSALNTVTSAGSFLSIYIV
ncbi:Os12g0244901 [Oryza sativa Japonica Group]|uniref:Os12g0244901 protein n=2 Tax=Oryza sativa subsp. japonica TaxID=39947 RepID=C7J9T6_ORYSJ|nr:Os12g0244901 [Oryza sativa Japonica Group]BAT16520.1 Os12g0244901 [Oryza sativa Japonica Group]|eukprot:NP_001176869.1 Os12g0244901 [Oryza sativa Japonica Group]